MKKRYKLILLGSIFVSCISGCVKGEEECIPTTGVAENVSVTATLTPSNYSDGMVAITEDNFGDIRFCNYLKENYDEDEDGFLSEKERTAITEVRLPDRILLEPYASLKGFYYFPELEEMRLNSVRHLEVYEVPKLKRIVWEGATSTQVMRLGEVLVKDCPLLEEILLWDTLFIGGSETELSRIEVENCPVIEWMSVKSGNMEMVSVKVPDAPKLHLVIASLKDGNWPHDITLDSHSILEIGLVPVLNIAEKKVQADKMNITWEGECISFEESIQELEDVIRTLQEGFSIEIQEVIPELYDDAGRKAYSVQVESAQLESRNYGVYVNVSDSFEEVREKYDYYEKGLVMYFEQAPKKEQFSFSWKEELLLPLEEYSPQRGMRGTADVFGTLVYTDESGREALGAVLPHISFSITEEGVEICTGELWEPTSGKYDTKAVVIETGQLSEGDVLICKENFSNIIFRDYLREEIDLDHNGVLSEAERERVTLINLLHIRLGPDVVDGFCYFPNLKSLYLLPCRKLSCVDCPELMEVAIFYPLNDSHWMETEVEVQKCPKLKTVIRDAYWSYESNEILSLKDIDD